jgi:hypothetical protein
MAPSLRLEVLGANAVLLQTLRISATKYSRVARSRVFSFMSR